MNLDKETSSSDFRYEKPLKPPSAPALCTFDQPSEASFHEHLHASAEYRVPSRRGEEHLSPVN